MIINYIELNKNDDKINNFFRHLRTEWVFNGFKFVAERRFHLNEVQIITDYLNNESTFNNNSKLASPTLDTKKYMVYQELMFIINISIEI